MKYAETLSLAGMQEMLTEWQDKLQDLIRRRNNTGKTWTESKIADWYKEHDKEIDELSVEIEILSAEINLELLNRRCKG